VPYATPDALQMKRALIIDDSRIMRRTLKKFLQALGFVVSEAGNGHEGLASISEHGAPHVALVDWNLPDMSGTDFVRSVRGIGDCPDLRIMLVTDETDIERMLMALKAGADEYFVKPFTKEVLEDKLALLGFVA